MKGGVRAEVYPYSELNNTECIKTACNPFILPSYRVNPQGKDDVGK